MSMNVKVKTINKLTPYSSNAATGGEWYSSLAMAKAMYFSVSERLAADDKTHILIASIRWSYSTSTEVAAVFENSEQGFIKACDWLDGMRIKFAEDLLS